MNESLCINSIKQIPKITPEAELSLSLAAYNGCEKSKQALILHLLHFLIKSLRAYRLDSDLFHDCLSEGTIALIKAVGSFNPQRGFTISSYVSWYIHAAIRDSLRKHNSLIAIPKNQWYAAKSAEKAFKKHLTTESTLSKAQLPQAALFSDIGDSQEQIPCSSRREAPEATAEHSYLKESISEGLSKLDPFTQKVIRARYGFEQEKRVSARKLAQELNCTRAAIIKAEETGRNLLRTFFIQKGLRSFVGGE